MADAQDRAVPPDDDGLREDPDGERVGNLTLDDLDSGARPAEAKDLVGDATGEDGGRSATDEVPAAPEEAPAHTQSQ